MFIEVFECRPLRFCSSCSRVDAPRRTPSPFVPSFEWCIIQLYVAWMEESTCHCQDIAP